MSTGAAGKRVAELLDRWLAGVELHVRYLALDDEAYAGVQDWPRHQRPTRWIVELARKRCLELKRQLAERSARGDEGFADALELMAFLTNLLGSEHVERFIPLPDPQGTRRAKPVAPAAAPPPKAPPARHPPPHRSPAKSKPGAGTRGTSRAHAAPRSSRAAQATQPQRRPAPVPASPAPPRPASGRDARTATVVADAVRLLNWGRPWPELASLIARLADRPAESEVWDILRRHRTEIEAQASPPGD